MSTEALPTARGSFSERVGMQIKIELLKAGMSGRELGRRLGESQTWVSSRTSGRVPIDVNELQRIADALRVSVADLIPSRPAGTTRRDDDPNASLPRIGCSAHVPTAAPRSPFPAAASRPSGRPRKNVTRPGSPVPATRRRPVPVQPPKPPSLRAALPMTA